MTLSRPLLGAVALALATLSSTPQAAALTPATLYAAPPAAGLNGDQADVDGTGALAQPYSGALAGTLQAVAWWGYELGASGGAANDVFSVELNGTPLGGALSQSVPDGDGVVRYELDVADVAFGGGAGTLALMNGTGNEWYWQRAAGTSAAHAFELIGAPAAVAVTEPGALALLLGALVPLATARRRRR